MIIMKYLLLFFTCFSLFSGVAQKEEKESLIKGLGFSFELSQSKLLGRKFVSQGVSQSSPFSPVYTAQYEVSIDMAIGKRQLKVNVGIISLGERFDFGSMTWKSNDLQMLIWSQRR